MSGDSEQAGGCKVGNPLRLACHRTATGSGRYLNSCRVDHWASLLFVSETTMYFNGTTHVEFLEGVGVKERMGRITMTTCLLHSNALGPSRIDYPLASVEFSPQDMYNDQPI